MYGATLSNWNGENAEPERSGDHEPQAKATVGSGNSAEAIVSQVSEARDSERQGYCPWTR